jgi:pSer/pThr/pTyr-binding forkhead associated (FHA) protein
MPFEADYEFGKRAVSAGQLTQDQLEECVEILVALERVGSKQRLWQIVQRKAYMAEAAIAEIRASVEGAAVSAPQAAPDVPTTGEVLAAPAPLPAAAGTADELRLPPDRARGFVLAHVRKGGEAKLYPLPPRTVTIGRGASCDIPLSEAGVLALHAKMSFQGDACQIEEGARNGGVIVNDERIHTRKLAPYDLVELGSALLLFLPDYGDQPAAEPVDAGAAGWSAGRRGGSQGGAPCARVRITAGARKGQEFFLGSSPLVIGRHALANVHLKEAAVGEFHAQIARTPQGTRVADLLSAAGTKVNGVRAKRQLLCRGDRISIGPVTLAFDFMAPPGAEVIRRPAETPVGREPATVPESEPRAAVDWSVGAEVEVEPVSDPFLRRGTKLPRGEPIPRMAFKAFKPGELRLACIKGPLEGKQFIIAGSSMVIGREKGLDLTIPDDAVSRRHAEIVLGPTKAEVKDLGSRNGIFVNSARVEVASIRPGDTLRVHNSVFVVEEIPPRPQPRKS